jgi:cephalosporin-C deacetylase-like acetyl esterase
MKNLIQLVNNVLTISPEALVIKEFHDIWKKDKTKAKETALKELAYVYHTTDYQSIYRNYHPSNRESKIKLDLFANKDWKPTPTVINAQTKYASLQTTLSMELLHDVELGLTKLRDYFRDVDFEDDENGVAAKNFIANVKAMGDVVKGMKSLREEVEKELSDQMQLRGGNEIGNRELPKDRRG